MFLQSPVNLEWAPYTYKGVKDERVPKDTTEVIIHDSRKIIEISFAANSCELCFLGNVVFLPEF